MSAAILQPVRIASWMFSVYAADHVNEDTGFVTISGLEKRGGGSEPR